ncbi:hypothetical protein N9129_04625 [Akkermansiaceae bacterium]|nr:hypothetical protein [Akkermansiaceae bacterium]MDB4452477.1 hypothetical protein [Akkermansiaceae bacterium]
MQYPFQIKTRRSLGALLSLVSSSFVQAQSWSAADGDFRIAENWTPASVPGSGDVANITNGGTATISDGVFLDVGRLLLGGDGTGSGNLTVSGGVTRFSTTADETSIVGNVATISVLSMSGGVIQIDDPDGALSGQSGFSNRFDFDGTGTNTWDVSGLNNKDLLIGRGGLGRIELHGDSKIQLGDDFGLANDGSAASQEATLIMDGTSLLAIGSGSEVGKVNAVVSITLAGDAVLASGNSLGPGEPGGQTDEGYFTVGTRDTGVQTISIGDRAELQCMTLQNRLGNTQIDLTGEGKLMVHDVFTGSGTILSTRPTYLSAQGASDTTITLRDSSMMLVDCRVATIDAGGDIGVNGLHVGGGQNLDKGDPTNPGSFGSTDGGKAILDVGDSALLDIKQGLHLGIGNRDSSDATLRITGPDATVTIGGNLNLAYNEYVGAEVPENGVRPGTGRLEYVLTENAASPVTVAGVARIGSGTLKLVLDDYVPSFGSSFTLIQAGSVEGEFANLDFSEALLQGGLEWKMTYSETSVIASVSRQEPPSITDIARSVTGEEVVITFVSLPGLVYNLEISSDLIFWEEHADNVISQGTSTSVTVPRFDPNTTELFFRLVID